VSVNLKRRAWLLFVLILLGGCAYRQKRPSLQVMALAARQETPLVSTDRVTAQECKSQPVWTLWGRDKNGRPMAVLLDKQIRGYVYTDGLTWDAALERIRAAGYEPLLQEPTLAPPKRQGWLVYVRVPAGTSSVALVAIPGGDLQVVPETALSPCDW
jgi:hypothetical protein